MCPLALRSALVFSCAMTVACAQVPPGAGERADLTITFHRPKTGLRARVGKALAGRILVAPIGIPPEVDRA